MLKMFADSFDLFFLNFDKLGSLLLILHFGGVLGAATPQLVHLLTCEILELMVFYAGYELRVFGRDLLGFLGYLVELCKLLLYELVDVFSQFIKNFSITFHSLCQRIFRFPFFEYSLSEFFVANCDKFVLMLVSDLTGRVFAAGAEKRVFLALLAKTDHASFVLVEAQREGVVFLGVLGRLLRRF